MYVSKAYNLTTHQLKFRPTPRSSLERLRLNRLTLLEFKRGGLLLPNRSSIRAVNTFGGHALVRSSIWHWCTIYVPIFIYGIQEHQYSLKGSRGCLVASRTIAAARRKSACSIYTVRRIYCWPPCVSYGKRCHTDALKSILSYGQIHTHINPMRDNACCAPACGPCVGAKHHSFVRGGMPTFVCSNI